MYVFWIWARRFAIGGSIKTYIHILLASYFNGFPVIDLIDLIDLIHLVDLIALIALIDLIDLKEQIQRELM